MADNKLPPSMTNASQDLGPVHEVRVHIIEVPEKRIFTYTRTYRIETTLTDEELIRDVNDPTDRNSLGFVYNAETLIDALDALSIEHECGVEMEGVKVELHNTKVDEGDPRFF